MKRKKLDHHPKGMEVRFHEKTKKLYYLLYSDIYYIFLFHIITGNQSSRVPRKSKKVTSPNMNPKKWKHDCDELIKEMFSLPYSVPFREPVSEIEFPDYHRYIATPMDLSTVRESLHIGDYNSPVDFQKDVKLIFKNSKDFNTNSKSKVLGMTYKLEEWFEQRIGK